MWKRKLKIAIGQAAAILLAGSIIILGMKVYSEALTTGIQSSATKETESLQTTARTVSTALDIAPTHARE